MYGCLFMDFIWSSLFFVEGKKKFIRALQSTIILWLMFLVPIELLWFPRKWALQGLKRNANFWPGPQIRFRLNPVIQVGIFYLINKWVTFRSTSPNILLKPANQIWLNVLIKPIKLAFDFRVWGATSWDWFWIMPLYNGGSGICKDQKIIEI